MQYYFPRGIYLFSRGRGALGFASALCMCKTEGGEGVEGRERKGKGEEARVKLLSCNANECNS